MSQKPLSQAAIGRALGLSPSAMTKLKGQGMPVDSVEAAQAWRRARQNVAARKPAPQAAASGRSATAPAAGSSDGWTPGRVLFNGVPVFGGADADIPEGVDEDRDTARTRREIAEANIAELGEARMRRELIKVSAVQTQLATDYATTRDAMLQIPARMAPVLAAESDPAVVQNALHEEIHRALLQLAGAADQVPRIEGAFD